MRLVFLFAAGVALTLAQTKPIDFDLPRTSADLPARNAGTTLRIVNWNIDRGTNYSQIGAQLDKNPGDLYLFQEVDWKTHRTGGADVAAQLAKHLQMNYSFGIEFEELSQEKDGAAYIGQATLTRLPVRRSRIIRFKRQSGFWKPNGLLPASIPLMQRRLGSRIALVDELEFAGKLLVVYNVHLESRSMGLIQAAQLDEILADLKHYPPDTAVILGGDINSKYFPSVFLHKLEREGFHSCLGEHIERTHAIMMALDWIFAKGPVSLTQGKIRKDLSGSDHYPIYAQLGARAQ